ncbi:MAG: polysaccharide deacetylase family protein [Patescibacteria group bacterium]
MFHFLYQIKEVELKNNQQQKSKITPKQDLIKTDLTKVPVSIIMYHSIDDFGNIPNNEKNLTFARNFRTPLYVLRKQIEILKKNNYKFITFKELEKIKNKTLTINQPSIILSFDDGFQDNFNAFLELKKNGIKGSFGLISDFVDKPNRLNKIQIKEMIADGQEIISHTKTHPDLRSISGDVLKAELLDSKNYFEKTFNIKVNTLIYPAGSYNGLIIKEVEKYGYSFAATVKPPTNNYINIVDSPLELPRIRSQCEEKANPKEETCNNIGNEFFLKLK